MLQLVPQHQVLTEEQKQVLLQRYNISEDKLPIMQEVDPIARYFGLSHGQVSCQSVLTLLRCSFQVSKVA